MAFGKKSDEKPIEIDVLKVESGTIILNVIGHTPLIYNCMSEKARRELLFPDKKTRAGREANLKHDPANEYRNSVYRIREGHAPTLLGFPTSAFKGAMEAAAKRIPGVVGEDVKQLIAVSAPEIYDNLVPIYGSPQLLMSVVRSAGQNKTPDIRTRAIVPQWACQISVTFIKPQFGIKAVGNLIQAAGIFVGIGDWRQEKGSGNHGLYWTDRPETEYVTFTGNDAYRRAAQSAALDNPIAFDAETENLFSWFQEEVVRRDRQKQLTAHNGNGAGNGAGKGGNRFLRRATRAKPRTRRQEAQ